MVPAGGGDVTEKQKRTKLGATIKSSFRLVLEAASAKDLFYTNLWLSTGVLGTVIVLFEKNFFNEAAQLLSTGSGFQQAVLWLALWMSFLFVTNMFTMISGKANYTLWSKMQYYIQEKLMIKIARIRVDYFAQVETYQKFEWVKNELTKKLPAIISATFGIAFCAIQLVTALLVISTDSWFIAVIILIGCIPSVILKQQQTEANYRNQQFNSHELRYQTYISWVMFKRPFMKEMRFGNLYDYIKERYEASVTEMYNKTIYLIKKYTYYNIGARLINLVTIGIALGMISYDIYKGRTGIGSFVLVYSTAKIIQSAFQGIFDHVILIGSDGRFIKDYEDIMAFEEYTTEKDDVVPLVKGSKHALQPKAAVCIPEQVHIEFREVNFSYPDTNRQVLSNVSVSIRQGEKIAIVGENGSGKSTFISLLCGMYKPDQGSVSLNQLDPHRNQEFAKRAISCTFQMFGKYSMSVFDNVRIGDLFRSSPENDIRDAAELSGADGFISRLSQGYQTQLGNFKEGGVELSGGEWQKLAIARAILKKESRILVLDEPTAALDPVAEAKLYEDFRQLTGDKTTILISHRLGATRLADRILLFHNGEIAEEGTHEELMNRNGRYAEMYRAQSQWYVA
jgi:ATP-binding cassette, subfamily B, bacterial